MIKLAVVSLRGAPVAAPRSAQFGPDGGTIGRGDSNTLVLDDPDRTVSRVHAQVLCRGTQFFVVDRGSNPMGHNGQLLGAGREAALADGDRLTIGSFELSVQAVQAAADPLDAFAAAPAASSDVDPFADLLAGLGPATPPAPVPARGAPPAGAAASASLPDPFAAGAAAGAADDPFADLLAPAPSGAAKPAAGLGALDDFSDLGAPPAGRAAGIDALFGGSAGPGGLGGDPLALSPLADPLRQPNTAGGLDPLAAFQDPAPVAKAPHSDHLPIGQFGYVPPAAMAPPAASSLLDDLAAPPGAALKFDDMTGLPIAAAPIPAPLPSPVPPPAPIAARAPAFAPISASASAASSGAAPDALLAAFLRGLGSTHQMPEVLTPGMMERIGVLLRSATEGTLQLLLTRQEFKREVRAEVTMIAAQANNPLKFSPTVEVALAHLLGPGVRGFMPAEAAMRDAFDDLRAHQFGVMVGMRAALAHVIERFGPDELEKKIAAKSALDSLFAANRKAKLWDQFIVLYAGIASEAEDDFHALFGKAFIEAYEAQMARLKSGG
ncbi:type VI secretion system-associated FHA domain protein TagH [Variovorax sp. PBL-E5]|uniref:type VI secretion system-associated FHA domain protein TagH n=1 Tax=Variovorax sp. PBL-E5 TaxID=434014 RepID=UPI0013197C34|nr:type VI secretion system-associated FHA domain protein TagH [Variovorax sp. PBL-E5]VTU38916.1 type VI secretion system FHA domain protein [Variovorax sp. PBL-E5]